MIAHGSNIEKIEVDAGYLNIFINKQALVKTILKEINSKKENYGQIEEDIKKNNQKNVLIEYSSPNIAKPMHIGHLRNTVIGGALHKLYRFLGYNVTSINFLGDWGINFAKIIAGYTMWKDEYDFSDETLDPLFDIYVRYNELEKADEKYTLLTKEWNLKLENGDEEALELWEWVRNISIKAADQIYDLLNCEFDSYNGEAFYNDKMEDVIEELKEKKLLIESEGAQIVDLEEYNMPPCIIITSNGTTLYATRDIASLKYRAKTYDFNKSIYVVGSEQQLHFKQIFKVFELMGYEKYAKSCEHVYYGMILDKEGKKMATRKGTSLNLIDILHEGVDKSKTIIKAKGTDTTDIEKLAKQIGIGAIIFNSLYTGKIKDVIFEWDSLLNFQGETGPYIQYIYVRTKSVLEKAGHMPDIDEVDISYLQEKQAIEILKLLYKFNEILGNVVEKDEPSILARYLIDLAQAYSGFYNEYKIITDDKNLQNARLFLTYCAGIVLKTGAELLGMELPDRM